MRHALIRDLTYFRRMNLAVVAGAAVATAVLAGALVVGDSVRGSLRQLTLERLGGVDHALAGQRFFPGDAVDRLAAAPGFADRFATAAPAILLQGSARHADTRRRASNVGLQGGQPGVPRPLRPGSIRRPVRRRVDRRRHLPAGGDQPAPRRRPRRGGR